MLSNTDKRKALFIAYEFPPMGGVSSIWATKLVKYLPAAGWEPIVLTVKDAPTNLSDTELLDDLPPSLRITRTFSLEPTRLLRVIRKLRGEGRKSGDGDDQANLVYSYSGLPLQLLTRIRALFIPDEKIGWFPFALAAAVREVRKSGAEVIFSTAPPFSTHLIASACKKLTGLPWVAEFRDPLSDYTLVKPPPAFNRWINNLVEKLIVRHADTVVCAMPGIVDGLTGRYPEAGVSHYQVITGGFDPYDFAGVRPLEDRFTMTWIGSMYSSLCPRTFFEVFRDLLDAGELSRERCVLRIVGTMDVEALTTIRELGIENLVELTGFVDHGESVSKMRSSHLLLMQLGKGRVSEIVYAAKTFEYFASGRPILAMVYEGATSRLLKETGAGTVVEPDDAPGIRKAILQYYGLYLAGEVPGTADTGKFREFDRKVQAERLAGIFDEVRAGRGSGV